MRKASSDQVSQLVASKSDSSAFKRELLAAQCLLQKSGYFASFQGIRLSAANLDGIDIQNFVVTRQIQTEDGVVDKDFRGTYDFKQAVFDHGQFTDCNFVKILMRQASFRNTVFVRCCFLSVDLTGADFEGSTFVDCSFRSNVMKNVSFRGVKAVCSKERGPENYHPFLNNKMDGVDLCGADLGDVSIDGLLSKKVFSKNRPNTMGFQIPTKMINTVGFKAQKIIDNWEVSIGKDRAKDEYRRMLGCLCKLTSNYHLLLPDDINSLYNTRFIKKPLREFIAENDMVLKVLHRQAVYKSILYRLFAASQKCWLPKDLVNYIFKLVGNSLPDKPFLHRKMLKNQHSASLRSKNSPLA